MNNADITIPAGVYRFYRFSLFFGVCQKFKSFLGKIWHGAKILKENQ